ncbi:MAG TPA: imelysin family protein [Candidatus Eisenbacteria bacterium]
MNAARKQPRRRARAAAVLALAAALTGCAEKDRGMNPAAPEDFSAALSTYAHEVVVPTYEDLAAKASALHAAIQAYSADFTSQAMLDDAAAAWIAAREPWEKSEAFLFGPAAYLSIDPSVDSWPVDRQQLNSVLASGFALTPQFIAQGLGPALRGFHTVEYLLFRDGAPRSAGDVTAREREYLIACSQVLADDAALLRDEWVGHYAAKLAAAGTAGSPYATQADALLEILDGMGGICDEVANGKIADPYDQQNVELEESQFSYNSLLDFQNNIRSVENAYRGGYTASNAASVAALVRERNAALDARLQGEIAAAVAAIAAIPSPFHDNLDKSAEIEAAQQAILRIQVTLDGEIKPLLLR